jgi:hypothetical protein
MTLDLFPIGAFSSWATVLQAYEPWILNDDDRGRHDLAAKLMSYSPEDADRTLRLPEPAFTALLDLIEPETKKLREAEQNPALSGDSQLAVVRQFWLETMPEALSERVGTSTRSLLELRDKAEAAYGLGK